VFYGILIVLGSALAGPSRIATAIRREAAPILNVRAGLTWGATAFVWLLLILWGGTHALRTFWGILIIGALIAAGVYVLRRQTLEEFPEAGTDAHHTLVSRMTAGAGSAAHRMASHRPHTAAEATAAGAKSPSEELARLVDLRDKGAITAEEYEQAKKIALS
jgi:Short C-terminal domain